MPSEWTPPGGDGRRPADAAIARAPIPRPSDSSAPGSYAEAPALSSRRSTSRSRCAAATTFMSRKWWSISPATRWRPRTTRLARALRACNRRVRQGVGSGHIPTRRWPGHASPCSTSARANARRRKPASARSCRLLERSLGPTHPWYLQTPGHVRQSPPGRRRSAAGGADRPRGAGRGREDGPDRHAAPRDDPQQPRRHPARRRRTSPPPNRSFASRWRSASRCSGATACSSRRRCRTSASWRVSARITPPRSRLTAARCRFASGSSGPIIRAWRAS